MHESHVAEYRMDIDRLQREMQEIKKKYFLQKKREQSLRYIVHVNMIRVTIGLRLCRKNRDKNTEPPGIAVNKAELPRFLGGGFNVKQTQKALA